MNFLLTNDDGINSKGILELYKEISKIANTTMTAPASEQSGKSHSITIHDPLKVEKFYLHNKLVGHSVKGSPADCVKIAVCKLLNNKPDLVISGINLGANLATNILYSGTVAAAIEASMHNIPAIAVSIDSTDTKVLTYAAKFTKKLVLELIKNGLDKKTLLNVNIPSIPRKDIKGVEITTQCSAKIVDKYEKRVDPKGDEYYWLYGKMKRSNNNKTSDFNTVTNDKISITPLHYDLTDYETYKRLSKFKLKI